MKKFLLATLVIIKNATIIMPLLDGMISALVNMIDADNKAKLESEKFKDKSIQPVANDYNYRDDEH